MFQEPETIHFKKVDKPVLSILTFYLEADNIIELDFNEETLTSTLQMIET